MKKSLIIPIVAMILTGCNLDTISSNTTTIDLTQSDQFALEDTTYQYGDSAWGKYRASSLYGTNKLVLTFDDGPHPVNTPKLLDTLKKYNAKATFFVLGEKLDQQKELIARMIREGHQVAGHDWDHTNNNNENYATHKLELEKAIRKIEEIEAEYGLNQREIYFRYPYGSYGKGGSGSGKYHHFEILKEVGNTIYGENCLNFVFWDIDTNDWVPSMTPYMIFRNAISQFDGGSYYRRDQYTDDAGKTKYKMTKISRVRNPLRGGVALFHDVHARSVEAIELILKYAQENNIEIVPITEVEEYQYSDSMLCELKE